MDEFHDPIHSLFAFEDFDDNDIDVSLIADQHLFNDGPDLVGLRSSNLSSEFMIPHQSGNLTVSSDYGTSLLNGIFPTSDPKLSNNNLDLFTNEIVKPVPAELTPLHQSALQFIIRQPDQRFGQDFGSVLPESPELPIFTINPAMLFDRAESLTQAQLSPQIVLASLEEQRLWQAFKEQQIQALQPQPETSQVQRIQATPEWDTGEDKSADFHLDAHFELPFEDMAAQSAQNLLDSDGSRNAQPVPLQQMLSNEQVQLLQYNEELEHAESPISEPPIEDSSMKVPFPRNEKNPRTSPRSRNIHVRRRNSSSYTETPEPDTQDRYQPQTQLKYLTFASLEEAEAAMPSRYIENSWEPPHPDNTVPNTQKKRAKYVFVMFQAFQDTSECKDNKSGHSYLKRWKDGDYYSLQAMEKVCWHMLDIAERLHTHGPSSTVMYCEEALKKLKGSRTLTFEQRIHAICAMLKFSKHLCDKLMKGEELESLVGAPKQKMSGATTMQVQNQRRQKWIVHGRTGDPLHTGPDENDSDELNMAEIVQPGRCKTQSKVKRAKSATSRAKTKARPKKILRDECDEEHESAHRRQSGSSIFRDEDEEMVDEPQYHFALEQSDVETPSPDLSPIRRSKIEKASKKGKVTMTNPLDMIANGANKPNPNPKKRKTDDDSMPEYSGSDGDSAPPAKRSKINGGSSNSPELRTP